MVRANLTDPAQILSTCCWTRIFSPPLKTLISLGPVVLTFYRGVRGFPLVPSELSGCLPVGSRPQPFIFQRHPGWGHLAHLHRALELTHHSISSPAHLLLHTLPLFLLLLNFISSSPPFYPSPLLFHHPSELVTSFPEKKKKIIIPLLLK